VLKTPRQLKKMKHKTKCLTLLLMSVLISFLCEAKPKPLHSGYYSAKQLQRRGYECEGFKGRICMTYKVYQNLITNKKVK